MFQPEVIQKHGVLDIDKNRIGSAPNALTELSSGIMVQFLHFLSLSNSSEVLLRQYVLFLNLLKMTLWTRNESLQPEG